MSVILAAVLWLASERLIISARGLSHSLRVSKYAVSAILMNFTLNLAELVIVLSAVFNRLEEMAISTVLGSFIIDITVVLGIATMLSRGKELELRREIIGTDMGLLGFASFFLIITVANTRIFPDRGLAWYMGVLLLAAYAAYVVFLLKTKREELFALDYEAEMPEKPLGSLTTSFAASALAVIAAGWFLVKTIGEISASLGISESVIGITIFAFLSSIPEHIVSFKAARKGEGTIVLGSSIGSSVQSVFLIFGLAILLSAFLGTPLPVTNAVIFGAIVLFGTILVLNAAMLDQRLTWFEGVLLTLIYILVVMVTIASNGFK